jgi:hypothetical protein
VLLLILIGAGYAMRGTLLLKVARVYLDRDPALIAQEKADGIVIVFAEPPTPWITPMKNLMNPVWQSIGADGVNYFTFAGPGNLFGAYSERSVPSSPYYQAWVGAYVTKRRDGTLPQDLPAWAKQVTELDQRSWLSAMGDPEPLAESSTPTRAGSVLIDGRDLELWHGTMRSHSDLSEKTDSPLATLVGMPSRSSWPSGTEPFHEVTLDGYFVCWRDTALQVSVVIYAVAAEPSGSAVATRRDIKDELMRLMETATIQTVH